MDSAFLVAYLVLALLAIGQSVLTALQTWEHCRYARSCMNALERFGHKGRALVVVPCKGLDVGLEENLRAVMQQDYGDFEVTFVVESEDDPACTAIHRVLADHPEVDARLLVAGRAEQSGQKIHNLLAATHDLDPEIKFLAFADSDAGPRTEWLRVLVGRLWRPGRGAVTGYRWFIPERSSIANHLVYSMNCDVMSLLGKTSHYLVWGGCWGIRRATFDRYQIRRHWHATLSDDLVASRILRAARLPVRFEPVCVVASPLNMDFGQMYEFVRRQYFVGRFYVFRWWLFAVLTTTLAVLAWWGNLAIVFASLFGGPLPAWLPAAVFGLLYAMAVFRGTIRQHLIEVYFPDQRKAVEGAGRYDLFVSPVVALVNWLGVIGSMFGRHITWRGITYRLFPGGKIRLVRRTDQPGEPPGPHDTNRAAGPLPRIAAQTVPLRKKAG